MSNVKFNVNTQSTHNNKNVATMSSIASNNSSANTATTVSASSAPSAPSANIQEYNIRVPKNLRKKHHVMRFNATLNVDFAQWRSVKLERENNMKEFKGIEEEIPKFGAGSEYNRELKEEVRRKKFGIVAKKYRPDAQPWILKVGGKSSKKFKGIREGGVGENAAFYVFTHAPDGAIEAYPLNEWYNFQPIQRYKALSAEEAEEEFGRRKRNMNFFTLMLRKRLKPDEEEEQDPDEVKAKGGGGKKSKELKISEMDEWIDSDDESDSDSDDEGGDGETSKKRKKDNSDDEGPKKKSKSVEKKSKKRNVNDEAFEESDDGDEEGREMDYDTESSLDEPDPEAKLDKDMKSVAEEDALRKLLTSDEEEQTENKSEESDKEEDDTKRKKTNKTKDGDISNKDKKKNSSSDFTTDSSDSEVENAKSKNSSREVNISKVSNNQNSSRSTTPTSSHNESTNKRRFNNMPGDLTGSENSNSPMSTPAKRNRIELSSNHTLPSTFTGTVNNTMGNSYNKDDFGITEEAVRRYLMRKPMTPTELLTKFKNKKTGVTSERLVETMTQILKKINPVKQTIQGKMYLSIKVNK